MLGHRDPRERDPAYMGWIAKLPCIACLVRGKHTLGVHVAHLRMGSEDHDKRPTGMAEKPSDRWTLPLCPPHHVNGNESQHHVGEEPFWEALNINPFDLCLKLRDAYESGTSGSTVIALFAARARRQMEGTAQ